MNKSANASVNIWGERFEEGRTLYQGDSFTASIKKIQFKVPRRDGDECEGYYWKTIFGMRTQTGQWRYFNGPNSSDEEFSMRFAEAVMELNWPVELWWEWLDYPVVSKFLNQKAEFPGTKEEIKTKLSWFKFYWERISLPLLKEKKS